MIKILDAIWFTGEFGLIGIVVVKCAGGEVKAYIGNGRGVDERVDARMIAHHGVPFYLKTLHLLAEHFEPTRHHKK